MDAMRPVVDPSPTRLDELASRDHGCVADDGDEVALPPGFDLQDAEAVLEVVKGDAVDQPGQDLGRGARPRCFGHQDLVDIRVLKPYRDRAGNDTWRARPHQLVSRWAVAASLLPRLMSILRPAFPP